MVNICLFFFFLATQHQNSQPRFREGPTYEGEFTAHYKAEKETHFPSLSSSWSVVPDLGLGLEPLGTMDVEQMAQKSRENPARWC